MDDLTLKFIINGEDKVSEKLTKVSETSNSAFTKIDTSGKKVNKTITETTNQFTKLNTELKNTKNTLTEVGDNFQNLGKKGMAVGTALTGLSALNIKTAADFEQGMNNVSTLIDTNTESLSNMSKKVLEIGRSSPKSLADLTDGLYSIRSAGISAEQQFKVLKGSEMLSVAGLSSTAEAVDIATSAINAFNLKGKDADKIYDMFFKVVKYGKTNISEFAQGFGSVTGVVSASKIKLDEYSAAIAAMTTSGVKASIAHTQVKAAIAGLSRGSKEQMIIFNKLGAKSFTDLVQKSGGMVNAFNRINKATGENQAKLIQLVGSVEAYNAILSLTGANNKVYLQTLNDMRYGNDAITDAYKKQMQGINNQVNKLKNIFQKISIDMGNALMPAFTKIVNAAEKFANFLDKIPDNIKSTTAIGTASIGLLLISLGTLSFATGGILKTISDLKKDFGVLASFASEKSGLFLNFLGDTAKLRKTELAINKIWNSTRQYGYYGGGKAIFQSLISDFEWQGKKRILKLTNSLNLAKDSISAFFKAVPSNSANALNVLKKFFIGIPANAGNGLRTALTAISEFSLKGFITSIMAGLKAFSLFSVGILTNPVGLTIVGIALAALLIVKYWKPITAFFRGTFKGIKDGLAPLKPTFTAIGNAVKPIIDYVKKLFTPINTDGKKAENWGYKFGQGIAWCITKIIDAIKWVKNLVTLGGRIKFGNRGALTIMDAEKSDGSHANGLNRVPFNGYRAILHQDEAVLTAKEARIWRTGKNSTGNISINYSPVINLSGTMDSVKTEFIKELQKHKNEIAKMLEDVQRRKQRGAYA